MSAFLLTITEQYIAEKKFSKEAETIRVQEYYLLCSLKEAEVLLQSGSLAEKGSFSYQDGVVLFQKRETAANFAEITFILTLNNGIETQGTGIYDRSKGEMVKWAEKN